MERLAYSINETARALSVSVARIPHGHGAFGVRELLLS